MRERNSGAQPSLSFPYYISFSGRRRSLCIRPEEAFKTKIKMLTEEADALWNTLVIAVSKRACLDVICVVDVLGGCQFVGYWDIQEYCYSLLRYVFNLD